LARPPRGTVAALAARTMRPSQIVTLVFFAFGVAGSASAAPRTAASIRAGVERTVAQARMSVADRQAAAARSAARQQASDKKMFDEGVVAGYRQAGPRWKNLYAHPDSRSGNETQQPSARFAKGKSAQFLAGYTHGAQLKSYEIYVRRLTSGTPSPISHGDATYVPTFDDVFNRGPVSTAGQVPRGPVATTLPLPRVTSEPFYERNRRAGGNI
jgi:hypothetical protein